LIWLLAKKLIVLDFVRQLLVDNGVNVYPSITRQITMANNYVGRASSISPMDCPRPIGSPCEAITLRSNPNSYRFVMMCDLCPSWGL
jgi:hypothetical protein